jgi:hydrogenase nickel incorporation protein HypA/HybF
MHELSICQSLLREVERTAVANGAAAVTGIVVAVGPLSGVEASLLARAFAVARMGTLAERATLDVENTPVIVRCRSCGAETAVPANALTCGSCGGWQVEVTSGDELLLKRVELAVDETPMAAAG